MTPMQSPPNPLAMLQGQTGDVSGPTEAGQSDGLLETLKGIMAAAVAVAEDPQGAALAEPMRQIRQLAMQAAIQIQQGGSAQGGTTPPDY